MRTVAPEVKAIEHPVEFLDGQNDRLVGGVRRCFESLGLEALEPKAEAVALPIQYLYSVAGLVEENEKHRVEYCDFNIQLDQRSQAVDGFSEVHRLGVQIHFFDFGIGSHHGELAPKGIGSTASGIS
ncbi:hypothetical protein D3C87_1760520 [compost metagenome]